MQRGPKRHGTAHPGTQKAPSQKHTEIHNFVDLCVV